MRCMGGGCRRHTWGLRLGQSQGRGALESRCRMSVRGGGGG